MLQTCSYNINHKNKLVCNEAPLKPHIFSDFHLTAAVVAVQTCWQWWWPDKYITPFLPGIAHSQFMRFMVPSGFFVGTATNPWNIREHGAICSSGTRGWKLLLLQRCYLQKDGPSAMPCAPGQAGSMQCLTWCVNSCKEVLLITRHDLRLP